MSDAQWPCPACTLLNEPSLPSCVLCETPKPYNEGGSLEASSAGAAAAAAAAATAAVAAAAAAETAAKISYGGPSYGHKGTVSRQAGRNILFGAPPPPPPPKRAKARDDVMTTTTSTTASANSAALTCDKAVPNPPPPLPPLSFPAMASAASSVAAASPWLQDEKFLGEVIVMGYATRSGRDLLPQGCAVILDRSINLSRRNKNGSSGGGGGGGGGAGFHRQKHKDEAILRFCREDGMDIGRMPKDASRWMSLLLDAGVVRLAGVCVDAPRKLNLMDECVLQISVFAQWARFNSEPGLMALQDDQHDVDICAAGSQMLTSLGMLPLRHENMTPRSTVKGRGGRGGDAAAALAAAKSISSVAAGGKADDVEGGDGGIQAPFLEHFAERLADPSAALPEATPGPAMAATLRSYQKQALGWMLAREGAEQSCGGSGSGCDETLTRLHPIWKRCSFPDGTPFYWHSCRGTFTVHFPEAASRSRGGILADAMGMGKTVEALALVATARESKTDRAQRSRQQRGPNTTATSIITSSAVVDSHNTPSASVARGGRAAAVTPTTTGTVSRSRSLAAFLSDDAGSSHVKTINATSNSSQSAEPVSETSLLSKATLVVCPMSLVAQWAEEATKHTPTLKVLTYYGTDRQKLDPAVLARDYDLVVTSYGTLAADHGAHTTNTSGGAVGGNVSRSRGGSGGGNDHSGRIFNGQGLLYTVAFWRVILDEAHFIKNRSSATARACFAVEADRRWTMTGTPIQNKLEDLFSLIRFLRVEPWCVFPYWRDNIQVPFDEDESAGLDMLQLVLQPLLLRRTKATLGADGKPILELPDSKIEILRLEMTEPERDFYQAIFNRSRTRFAEFQAAGKVMSNYANVLEMLLRLRQACDHPFLTLKNASESGTEASIAAAATASSPRSHTFKDIDALMETFVAQSGGALAADFAREVAAEIKGLGEAAAAQGSKQGGTVASTLSKECCICFDSIQDPVLTPCAHVGCAVCFGDIAATLGFCPVCRRAVDSADLVHIRLDGGVEEGDEMPAGRADVVGVVEDRGEGVSGSCGGVGGGGKTTSSPSSSSSTTTLGAGSISPEGFVSSTKIERLISELESLDKGEKCVVFSQWTSMLDLTETALRARDLGFVRLDGSLSQAQRTAALELFRSDPNLCVFLISLRSGGVGLNLTAARHVILLDPWWNPAVEEQAIDRVHRIGQEHAVCVRRLIMAGTVEERILDLQARKKGIVQTALNRTPEAARAERMADLKLLFGLGGKA